MGRSRSIGIALIIACLGTALAAAPTPAADVPEPIRRALAAVDLTPEQLGFDRHDMGLYGGPGAWENIAPPRPFLDASQYSLLSGLLDVHLNYFLSDEVITSSGLPLGALKEVV